MTRRHITGLLLILLLVTVSCSSVPTSPSFPYEGVWTGFWKDYYVVALSGSPLGGPITLNVGKDGVAVASGSRKEVYSNGTLSDRISMTLSVLPDGSVYGTGEWHFSFTGMQGLRGYGEVRGQLDAETGFGTGDLLIEKDGILWHFPWRVEKSK